MTKNLGSEGTEYKQGGLPRPEGKGEEILPAMSDSVWCVECGRQFKRAYKKQNTCSDLCKRVHMQKVAKENRIRKQLGLERRRNFLCNPWSDPYRVTDAERVEMGATPLRPRERSCRRCLKPFRSWGLANRLCDVCRAEI